jgi:hypothetical protein
MRAMKWAIVTAALVLLAGGSQARARPPLSDPVTLNIGLVCQWQSRCMAQQKGAMKRSLKLVRKYQPPTWRIEMCNRNASRSRFRVDWMGFENCIRNTTLRPAPLPARSIIIVKKRPRRLTQSDTRPNSRLSTQGAPATQGSSPPVGFGERG